MGVFIPPKAFFAFIRVTSKSVNNTSKKLNPTSPTQGHSRQYTSQRYHWVSLLLEADMAFPRITRTRGIEAFPPTPGTWAGTRSPTGTGWRTRELSGSCGEGGLHFPQARGAGSRGHYWTGLAPQYQGKYLLRCSKGGVVYGPQLNFYY
jgi:hypothetical protein